MRRTTFSQIDFNGVMLDTHFRRNLTKSVANRPVPHLPLLRPLARIFALPVDNGAEECAQNT